MVDVVVNDILPRVQYTATASQTVFSYAFLIFEETDLKVYKHAAAATPNDSLDILVYNVNYTVTNNVAPLVGGTITLTTGATSGDIVTIIQDMPEERLSNYLDGGQFLATDVNTDFDRTVLMNQTNRMYSRKTGPHYNTNAVINTNSNSSSSAVDLALPILPPLCSWRKNAADTAIEAITIVPTGSGIVLPTVANHFAIFQDAVGTLFSSYWRQPLADGIAGQSWVTDGAGNVNVGYALPPVSVSGINRIVNGDFQVWQRGAGGAATFEFANTATYTADRWQGITGGAGTTMQVTEQTAVNSGSKCARVQRKSANAGTNAITFATSLPRDFCVGAAGNYMTLSFKARKGALFSAASSTLGVVVNSGTGTSDISDIAGAFTGNTAVINTTTTLTTSWASGSISTAAALGATVTQLYVSFFFSGVGTAGATDYFEVTDVQLEVGQQATSFQRLSFQETYNRCLEFYCKSFAYNVKPVQNAGVNTGESTTPATQAGATTNYFPYITFPLSMSVVPPVVVTYNPAAANAEVRDETAGADCTAVAVTSAIDRGFLVSCTGNAGTIVSGLLGVHWSADSDLT